MKEWFEIMWGILKVFGLLVAVLILMLWDLLKKLKNRILAPRQARGNIFKDKNIGGEDEK